jgi:hypothetical protein
VIFKYKEFLLIDMVVKDFHQLNSRNLNLTVQFSDIGIFLVFYYGNHFLKICLGHIKLFWPFLSTEFFPIHLHCLVAIFTLSYYYIYNNFFKYNLLDRVM